MKPLGICIFSSYFCTLMTFCNCRGAPSLETVYRTFVESNRTASLLSQSQHQHHSQSSAVPAALIASREPSISRALVSLSREASPSRSLHVITRSRSRDNTSGYSGRSPQYGGLLTVTTSPQQHQRYQSCINRVSIVYQSVSICINRVLNTNVIIFCI